MIPHSYIAFAVFNCDFTFEEVVELAQQFLSQHGIPLEMVWVERNPASLGWTLYVHRAKAAVAMYHREAFDKLIAQMSESAPDKDDHVPPPSENRW